MAALVAEEFLADEAATIYSCQDGEEDVSIQVTLSLCQVDGTMYRAEADQGRSEAAQAKARDWEERNARTFRIFVNMPPGFGAWSQQVQEGIRGVVIGKNTTHFNLLAAECNFITAKSEGFVMPKLIGFVTHSNTRTMRGFLAAAELQVIKYIDVGAKNPAVMRLQESPALFECSSE